MTFVVTLVLGMGLILIVSALDNTPVVLTFAKILGGGTSLDLSGASGGTAGTSGTGGTSGGSGGNKGGTPPVTTTKPGQTGPR